MNFGNVLIFGDSYSTFKDSVPEGYAVYYTTERANGPNITQISDTWWHQLLTKTDSALVLNDSWSGSTIGYTGYDGSDNSESSSFIFRLKKMTERGFFKKNHIDTVFVFGGTNDNWADAPIGSTKYKNLKEKDFYSALPAVCHFIDKLKEAVPKARIIFIINSELKYEITTGIKRACRHYGIEHVLLSKIDKECGHPTVNGMKQISEQIAKKANITLQKQDF